MSLTNELIQQKLIDKFGDQVVDWIQPYGMLTFTAPKDLNLKVLQFLYDDPELKFQFLTDLQAVHYPDNKGAELAVVYHLHNLTDNIRIRFKVFTDINNPDLYSATALYAAANFMEYCVRTLRKTGSGITFITQGVEEIVASAIGPAILNNTATKFVMLQRGDTEILKNTLKVNYNYSFYKTYALICLILVIVFIAPFLSIKVMR